MALATSSPPFTECPAIGNDTSCGILVDVTGSGQSVLADPNQGPYDGSDDTLIGVLNSSSSTVTSLQLSSSTNIFGFDGDGICSGYSGAPSGCPLGSTGYEGPGTSYSNINADGTGGVVTFSPGIAPGGTAYFALEEPLSSATVFSGGPSPAEQGAAPNASENSTTCSLGAPVNCATGSFWHTFTDSSIRGLGVPLDFTRTYTSAAASTNGPLGYGWTDSYDMSLSFDTTGNATITQEDGSAVTFDAASGGYVAPPWVLATFGANGDGTYTFKRDSNNVQYVFNASGQLIREVDRNGYATTLSYDGSGNLTTVTDQAGRTLSLTYSGGHISALTDPMGHVTDFGYDPSGNLTSATDPLGRTWSFAYDPSHLLLSMTDPRGGTTANTYDNSGRVTAQVDPAGRTTKWSYNGDPSSSAGGTTTATDPRGVETSYAYSNLELTSVTRAVGTSAAATTSYAYDPATLGRTTITDPNGHATTNTYDPRGDQTSSTDSLGNTTHYTYDGAGDLLNKTDPLGTTTTYTYDSNGNLLSKSTPLSGGGTATWSYTYGSGSSAGELLSGTNPDGKTTDYGYDGAGDLTSITNSLGKQTSQTYDGDGHLLTKTTPDGNTTTYVYDAGGELTTVTDPRGRSTSYTYDDDGNQTSSTDANGHRTTFTYDPDNERTQTTAPDASAAKTTFDGDGNALTQTDASGHTTTYAYDSLGRVASATDPDGHTTTYSYDGAGNLLTALDPSGRTMNYTYDEDNRVTGISYSDGSTPSVSESYDADGRRTSMTDGTGTSTFAYDTLGHLTSQTNGAGATIGYAYDAAGNITGVTYPNGQTVSRAYDDAGQLQSVSDWLGNKTAFGYDGDGNPTSEDLPGSVTSSSTYDANGRLTGVTDSNGGGTIASFNYARDAAGQLTNSTASGAVSGSDNYSYDAQNRLTANDTAAYGYDTAGNPTNYGGQPQTFDAADQLQTSGSTIPGITNPPQGPPPPPPGHQKPKPPKVVKPPLVRDVRIDAIASAHKLGKHRSLSVSVRTRQAGDLLVALVSARGPARGGSAASRPHAPGLTWTMTTNRSARHATVAIWTARATRALNRTVVVTRLSRGATNAQMTVVAFAPGAALGAGAGAAGRSGAPRLRLRAPANAMILAVGNDASSGKPRTTLAGSRLIAQLLSRRGRDASWVQSATPSRAGTFTLGDRSPRSSAWSLAAIVVEPATTLARDDVRAFLSPSAGTATGQRSFAYNPEGDRTSVTASGTTVNLGYDQANQLVSVGPDITYSYDGDGLRASKSVNGTPTQFAWDESGSLPLLLQDGDTYYIYGPGGSPIEQITGNTPTYLLGDQQGSTRILTDNSGNVVGTYSYDAWGNVTGHTGSATSNLQYDGQYTDAETGYQYLRARYYDPSTGQFLSVDPAVSATRAPYSYAADTPAMAADPTGLFCLLGKNPGGGCRGAKEAIGVTKGVHFVAGVVGTAAGTCGLVLAVTGVGAAPAAVCEGVAAVSGGISLATGEVLYATGHESGWDLSGDLVGSVPFLKATHAPGLIQLGVGYWTTGSSIYNLVNGQPQGGDGGTSHGTSCANLGSSLQGSTGSGNILQPAAGGLQ